MNRIMGETWSIIYQGLLTCTNMHVHADIFILTVCDVLQLLIYYALFDDFYIPPCESSPFTMYLKAITYNRCTL